MESPDPGSVEAYVAKYGAAKVTVGGKTEAVEVPEVTAVRAALGGMGAGSRAGEMGYEMVRIPAGSFVMGSPLAEDGRDEAEVQHKVTISRAFWLGKTEVTQGLWAEVMGGNPSRFAQCGSTCPVENLSWLDAVAFANELSEKEGLEPCYRIAGEQVNWPKGVACAGYRLPTEAEWEYAARAGEDGLYAGGNDPGAVGWTSENAEGTTHAVGQKQANGWGLVDMSGNVWEWVWDAYAGFPTGAVSDPTGASTGLSRVRRGGSWDDTARFARLAYRGRNLPGSRFNDLGLRLARSIP